MSINKVTAFIERISKEYGYKSLPSDKSLLVREWYTKNIPSYLNINGDIKDLYSLDGTLICHGYTRIVVGDYGAYIEFTREQAVSSNYKIAPGQEYRFTDRYRGRIKYYWYTTKDNSNCKIYLQTRTVSYADYKVQHVYISPYEVVVLN